MAKAPALCPLHIMAVTKRLAVRICSILHSQGAHDEYKAFTWDARILIPLLQLYQDPNEQPLEAIKNEKRIMLVFACVVMQTAVILQRAAQQEGAGNCKLQHYCQEQLYREEQL